MIGDTPRVADPNRGSLGEPSRVLVSAVAQGLVRFDATGQVEPAIAESWIVIGDGTSYIFRLRDARWSDGSVVTADQVARRLRATIAPRSRNPLRPFLSAIAEIVVMTPQVIEMRLSSPRPELLRLLAQPEMAILSARANLGTGPFVIADRTDDAVTLRPAPDPDAVPDTTASPDLRETVMLRGERAALAVARFRAQRLDLVAGGTFVDRPVLAAASIAARNIRSEAVSGLFGLAVVRRQGFLAEPENRMALAMAIDRDALATALGTDVRPEVRILPSPMDAARAPVEPGWAALSAADRRAAAAARVAAWRATVPTAPPLRLALPEGPGSTLVFARIRADLAAIGLVVERVVDGQAADLRLVDAIAPSDNARWFLATACRPCGEVAQFALEAARTAPTTATRAARLAEADTAVAADAPFIPLAHPTRWSLVSLRLRQWTGNPRGVHPLNRLRNDTN